MRSTTFTLPVVSTLVAAALALTPYNLALAAPAAKEPAKPEAKEPAKPAAKEPAKPGDGTAPAEAPADPEPTDGETPPDGEPAEGDEGGEPAEGDEGGEPAEGDEGGAPEEPAEPAEPEEPEEPAEPEEPEEPAAAPEDFEPEDDGKPEEPRVAGKSAKGTGLMITGGVGLGVGAAWTLAFGLMTRNCSIDGPLQCRLENQDTLLIPLGISMMVASSIVLGLGVGFRLRYKRWERWTPGQQARVAPMVSRQVAGLTYSARF